MLRTMTMAKSPSSTDVSQGKQRRVEAIEHPRIILMILLSNEDKTLAEEKNQPWAEIPDVTDGSVIDYLHQTCYYEVSIKRILEYDDVDYHTSCILQDCEDENKPLDKDIARSLLIDRVVTEYQKRFDDEKIKRIITAICLYTQVVWMMRKDDPTIQLVDLERAWDDIRTLGLIGP